MKEKVKKSNWQLFPSLPTYNFYSQVMQRKFWGRTFQSECDWCIGSRYPYENKGLLFGNPNVLPKTIFVNLEGNIIFFIKIPIVY